MKFVIFTKQLVKSSILPGVFLALTTYFIMNTLQGSNGIDSYRQKLKLLEQAKSVREDALKEHKIWESRAKSLSDKSLDRDILDERVRIMLNLTRKEEIIIPYDINKRD